MNSKGRDPGAYVYTPELEDMAAEVLRKAQAANQRVATAESCTGGALAALLTDVEGLSHVFDRGYAVYSEEAKQDCLGVSPQMITLYGAVSEPVARAMAQGALERSRADIAVAITGNAGPAGPNDEEGLVFICASVRRGASACRKFHFGSAGRPQVRIRSLEAALDLLKWAVGMA
jgi:nicotinamide-nucleotide amidase